MPFIDVRVTTPVSKEQEISIKTLLGQAITVVPGKGEYWLMVGIQPEACLYFGGSNASSIAYVGVSLFGGEDKEAFAQLTGKICEIMESVLEITPDHVYVKYDTTMNWGWNGNNF